MSVLLLYVVSSILAQQDQYIEGIVEEQDELGQRHPLLGANVYWKDTLIGTITDTEGKFQLIQVEGQTHIIVSHIVYPGDTIDVSDKKYIEVTMDGLRALDEVKVIKRKKSTEIGYLEPIKTEKIGEKELLKAACCNLSESFETNPSVDISFTDAITGTRQISMLGLAGPYTQITRENIPYIRGLSSVYGLTFIPGTWIESIQLNKGTGSVANGYESIAGQINVDIRNPANMDKVYFNVYGNEEGRLEVNANLKADVGKKWGTALLLHGKYNSIRHDRNNDGFMDMPLSNQLIALNRWELNSLNGLHLQFGAKGTYIDNIGGQTHFNLENDEGTVNAWGMHLNIKRFEGWTKIGKINRSKEWQSIGFQLSGAVHDQHSFFGLSNYEAGQKTLYANLLYQSIIGNTNHHFRTGTSLQYDEYRELLDTVNYDRIETVPGIFFEYTYTYLEKFSMVAGIRADYHNHYGLFFTPRLHVRYAITEKSIVRLSGGRGQRTANILSENSGILASSRQINILGDGTDKPYGLDPEIAWNYGLNFTQHFRLDYRDGTISLDFYRTDFTNQVVIDLDENAQRVSFYNLEGESYSNSFQSQIDYELINRLDVRLAYRYYDVKTTYNGQLQQKPLVAKHRSFINLTYETRNHWKFDYTMNWQGIKRIPDTHSNPEEYRLSDYSPDFYVINTQISKTWHEKFEIYIGAENLLDYKQENPVISESDPFGSYFDSSLIWGPVFGRNIYVGMRYKIK